MSDSSLIPVPVGVCRCPGTPHPDGDVVYLHPVISLAGGIVAQQSIMTAPPSIGAVTAALAEAFLVNEVAEWTFSDDDGPVPVSEANIRRLLLSDFTYATPIADKASELYADAVISPLRVVAVKSSKPSQTNGSTSPPTGSSPRRPKPPKPSSTTTSPTADTAPTSD